MTTNATTPTVEPTPYWLYWRYEDLNIAMSEHATEADAEAAIPDARAQLTSQGFSAENIAAARWDVSTVQPD